MNNPTCESLELAGLLHDDCDVAEMAILEAHLEHCDTCQSRLTELAADEALWTQTASHLSTVEQIELPKRLTSKFSDSSSFVVPTISQPSENFESSDLAYQGGSDWTQILDPPAHPEILGQIDQFEVESKIGQGGMGIVLKGFDRELNRAVAIKVLSPHLAVNGTARKRFAREAESAAAVMHPNVVPIYSVNKSPSRPYLVMQLVPGHSLQSLVAEKGPLAPKEVVRVSMQIASGLAAAHKQGLIHRDVKPGNILMERDVNRVMITDFGLARAADDAGMTQTGWLAGTPHYMSPEQSQGETLDERTDLFSLGSLMYFLATGREPFRGNQPYAVIQKIITQQPTDPTEINSDVPPPLADIIEKLLEKEPKDRFASAEELVKTLEDYLAFLQHPKTARPPKRILTARKKRRRAWTIGAVFTGTLISLAILAAVSGSANRTSDSAPRSSSSDRPADASAPATNRLPTPATMGFDNARFSQQFSSELSSVASQIEALEKSLQATAPLASKSTTGFSGLDRNVYEFETHVKTLESGFEFAGEQMKRFSERSEKILREQSTRQEEPHEKQEQLQSKGSNDED